MINREKGEFARKKETEEKVERRIEPEGNQR